MIAPAHPRVSNAAPQSPRVAALDRVLQSQAFHRSLRLSAFLKYVGTRTLSGRLDEISEQQVGVHVFGKSPGYNPADDNVVRSAARQLRQRLALYYQEEGADDPIRITLPRGGYVIHFEDAQEAALPDEVPAALLPKPSLLRSQLPGLLLGFALAACLAALIPAAQHLFTKAAEPLTTKFWDSLFPPHGKTYLVPCDSGVVMVQNVTKKSVTLSEYSTSGYELPLGIPGSDSFVQNRFGIRKYTSIADVKLAAQVSRLPQVANTNLEIRFGRDLRLEDLKDSNAILVGGPQGNPWIDLFDHQANFRIETDDYTYIQTVVNANPQAGEQPTYTVQHLTKQTPIYSILTYLPNLEHSGHVMTIAGTSMAGIDASSEFLFRAKAFEDFLHQAQRPDGSFRSFELLLQADSISTNAIKVRVIGKRFRD